MSKYMKIMSIAMALAIVISSFTVTAGAVLGDGQKISVDMDLEVGTYNGDVFTKLSEGKTLKANDIITVRISPKSDFLCGASCYVVMFSNLYFQMVGKDKAAFTANTGNSFYSQVAADYYGYSALKMDKWPSDLVQNGTYNDYTAVSVGNTANSFDSPNGGYPGYLPGDWLFSFNLRVVQDITDGCNARIWMDKKWIRSSNNTSAYAYFVKCESEDQLSALGSAVKYNFDIDLTHTNIKFPISYKSTITFNSNGGTEVAPITGDIGSALPAPANPTKTNYTFTGWNPTLPATFPAEGLTVTAQWAPAPLPTMAINSTEIMTGSPVIFTIVTKNDVDKIRLISVTDGSVLPSSSYDISTNNTKEGTRTWTLVAKSKTLGSFTYRLETQTGSSWAESGCQVQYTVKKPENSFAQAFKNFNEWFVVIMNWLFSKLSF